MRADWEASKSKSSQFLFHVGRQTGKSFLLNTLAIEYCLRNPRTTVVVIAPIEKKLSAFIRGILSAICADCPEDLAPERLENKNQLVFKNGSVIHYFGSTNDNHNAIRGIGSVSFLVLDEAGFFSNLPELVSVVAPMLLRTRGYLVYSSSSPVTPDHPFVALIEQAKLEGWYCFHPTWDNTELDPESLDQLAKLLGGKLSTKWRREVGCELVVERTRQVLPEWDSHKYVKEIARPATYQFLWHIVSFDPGFKDPSAVTFATYLFGHAVLYIEDEIVIPSKDITIDKLALKIRSKVKELWGDSARVSYWADPSNQTLLDAMGNKQAQDGGYAVFFNWTAKDKKKMYLEQMRAAIGQGGIVLHPKCVLHKTMFENTIWNQQRSDFERSASGFHGDCIDSTLYAFRNMNTINPVPALFQVDKENTFIGRKPDTEEEKHLKGWVSSDWDEAPNTFNNDTSYLNED